MIIVLIIISLLLDGLFTNILPFMVGDLSIFTPLFTLTLISILYPCYRKREKTYFITIFITGIIYDLLYTNLLFFNGLLFLSIGYLSKIIHKNYEINYLRLIIYIILIITVYETIYGLILVIFNLIPVDIVKLFYKIIHSLIINIIYGELIYLLINKLPKKYTKISIN